MADLPPRFAEFLSGLRALDLARPRLPRYPGLASQPWHDEARLLFPMALETAASDVLAEMRALGDDVFAPEREPIERRGAWDVAFFYERGRRNDALAARCPRTISLIESFRTVRGPSGLAYLSRLRPGAHVAPHRGPTNVRLRCHFGVRVPSGCGISVGGERRAWREGRTLVFDDSFVHEAYNGSHGDRIVLIVDLWHPDLSDDEVLLLEGLDRIVAASGENLARYWASNRRPAADASGPSPATEISGRHG